MNKIIDRKTNEQKDLKIIKSQKFLYRTLLGRLILKPLTKPWFTKWQGRRLDSPKSVKKIPKFIKENNIDTSIYVMEDIHSYNDFFTRKIKDGARPIDNTPSHLISPCDSKLSAYKIEDGSIFNIKDSYYKVSDLINNEELAKEYLDGYCLIFRLAVDDYHRYCYIDSGTKEKNIHIDGVFHTVNPIALEHYNIYKRNTREWTILHTKNFGDVIHVEVGAMMVGKIKNHHQEYEFKRGDEKGMFLFGGSTIVLLVKNNVIIDTDILNNTKNGDETTVKYGERIGESIK